MSTYISHSTILIYDMVYITLLATHGSPAKYVSQYLRVVPEMYLYHVRVWCLNDQQKAIWSVSLLMQWMHSCDNQCFCPRDDGLRLFPRVQLASGQHLFRYWLDAEESTCYYMKNWWPSLLHHVPSPSHAQWISYTPGRCGTSPKIKQVTLSALHSLHSDKEKTLPHVMSQLSNSCKMIAKSAMNPI